MGLPAPETRQAGLIGRREAGSGGARQERTADPSLLEARGNRGKGAGPEQFQFPGARVGIRIKIAHIVPADIGKSVAVPMVHPAAASRRRRHAFR
jgi:hypothetical protein